MSGIVGLVSFGENSIDPALMDRLVSSMAFRGPDQIKTWIRGGVAFGHALLQTTHPFADEQQPFSFDGAIWIVADARIDGREELVSKLRAKLAGVRSDASDSELILYAYQAWQENCVANLIGDFSFCIWDEPRKKLFCARDHFGVKPFFYSECSGTLVFSNTLSTLRLHPSVSDELDERFIADFLIYGFPQEPTASAFKHIKRLPAAHCLSYSRNGLSVRRYWTLPIKEPIRYRRDEEYIEHYNELLSVAVRDRLRSDRVLVDMSGGLDSTSLSLAAKRELQRTAKPYELNALTLVYKSLIPDDEGVYAKLAADSIGMPIQVLAIDDYIPHQGGGEASLTMSEPADTPYLKMLHDVNIVKASRARVVLNGQGGDEIMRTSGLLVDLVGKVAPHHLLHDVWSSLFKYHVRPGVGLRGRLIKPGVALTQKYGLPFPDWIENDLERKYGLRERHTVNDDGGLKTPARCLRPVTWQKLAADHWAPYFEGFDPGQTGVACETRWPYLDLRLVEDLLAFPPFPWFSNRCLQRSAIRGVLPDQIVNRPKTPQQGYPYHTQWPAWKLAWGGWVEKAKLVPELHRFVNVDVLNADFDKSGDQYAAWLQLRVASLYYWLKAHQTKLH